MRISRNLFLPALLFLIFGIATFTFSSQAAPQLRIEMQPEATPTVDRLAIPVLPENPTQFELGNNVYYHHCMPCHGDRGQGLTDEWREVWEEDHQDCWGKGCHSFRDQDEVFTIPTTIPPVVGTAQIVQRFSTPLDLFEYLRSTHPPQNPGILSDEEYWALTDFLLIKNGKLSEKEEVGPQTESKIPLLFEVVAGISLGMILVALLFFGLRKIKRNENAKS